MGFPLSCGRNQPAGELAERKDRNMTLSIRGLGTATPERTIDQVDAAEIAKTLVYGNGENENVVPMLYRLTRVRRRGSVLLENSNGNGQRQSFYPAATTVDDRGPATEVRMQRFATDAPPLAIDASSAALSDAQLDPGRITHLVTVSCTGFNSPGIDIALIKALELSPSVGRVNVGFMGCHGALNGLRVAQSFVDADPRARVLMCCVELCTLHYHYGWDSEKMVANALFADGAAALVAEADASRNGTDRWRLASCASCLFPDSEDEMTWKIGDYGFEMTLSACVPDLIHQHLRPWLSEWLASQGLTIADVGSWAVHPGGPRIIQSAARALDLPRSATEISTAVLAEHGNMSSSTVLFVIDRLRQTGAGRPCVAIAFGPGLVAEAALFV